ncbi:MAG: hypothetical protein AAGD32_13770 [Planctomycetota bacterium]
MDPLDIETLTATELCELTADGISTLVASASETEPPDDRLFDPDFGYDRSNWGYDDVEL